MNEKKQRNYGIYVLKIWMCFEVVVAHCWSAPTAGSEIEEFIKLFRFIPVPVFMILSFYLCYENLRTGQMTYLRKRFARLIIPYISWCIIYFGVDSQFLYQITLKDMMQNLLTGIGFCGILWFQLILIILSILVIIISKLFQNTGGGIYLIVLAVSLILQYTEWNYRLFSNTNTYIQYSYGRIIEMLPYMIIGIYIYVYTKKVVDSTTKKCCVWLAVGYILSYKYLIVARINGFSFQGIPSILLAISIVSIFMFLPFERLPQKMLYFIEKLGNCTMGIYFIHVLIRDIWSGIFKTEILVVGSLGYCCAIWLLSLIITIIISKTPIKLLVQ